MTLNSTDLMTLFGPPSSGVMDKSLAFSGVCIDSRKVKPGYLFVAIRGGHDFIHEAVISGAQAIISEKPQSEGSVPVWVVPDSIAALSSMGVLHRSRLACPAIALTGSNGKTTVKEMISAILPKPSYATPGNFNNHIGVPLSLLQLQPTDRYAVFELGANHAGEIAHTVAMVQPQVVLINNIAPAHIEGFGSIDGVARAKGEIYLGLVLGGTAVINDDDAYAHFWDADIDTRTKSIIRFSTQKPADVYARELRLNEAGAAQFWLVTPQGEAWIELKVPGLHNASNALAACACTMALGIPLAVVAKALSTFGGVTGRMTYRMGKNRALIIDDTYNANLRSTLIAIDVLAQRKGRRILVFGDMGELGAFGEAHHREVGLAARASGINVLLTCGRQSQLAAEAFGHAAKHYASRELLVDELLPLLDEQTTVLVKGSRSSAMERIVDPLLAHESQQPAFQPDKSRGG